MKFKLDFKFDDGDWTWELWDIDEESTVQGSGRFSRLSDCAADAGRYLLSEKMITHGDL